MTTTVNNTLETRCRSLANECSKLHTLFALTDRPQHMVDEIAWARDTLNILADGIDIQPDFNLFAVVTIEAVKRERLGMWRAAAQYTLNKAKGK